MDQLTKDNTEHRGDSLRRSAKSVIASVISQQLYSIPGYSILEDYNDRICSNLPDDYNNAAVRLQTLIGASDHMIQWILTGDMSKVNHRIYQVVLVYVCFEPHFIKFCDIMEALVSDNRIVLELRKILINQLCTDGCITGEEASWLTSEKLFKTPYPTATVLSITLNENINPIYNEYQIPTSRFYNSIPMHGTTVNNQKVFLSCANEDTQWLTPNEISSSPSATTSTVNTTATLLNANRNNVCNGDLQISSTVNNSTTSIACNIITTATSTTADQNHTSTLVNDDVNMLTSIASTDQCEVESQPVLEALQTDILAPNNIDTLDSVNHQTTSSLNIASDDLLSDHTEANCSSNATSKMDNETRVPSVAVLRSDNNCCSIDNGPVLNLIVTSNFYTKETAEDTSLPVTAEDSPLVTQDDLSPVVTTSVPSNTSPSDEALTGPDVCTANEVEVQSHDHQEQQSNIAEEIPDLKNSEDSGSVLHDNTVTSSDATLVTHSKLDPLPSSENAKEVSTVKTTESSSSEQPSNTTAPVKPIFGGLRDLSSMAAQNPDTNSNAPSSVDKKIVTVVLTQTRPGTTEQLELNQFIDFTMDKDILTFYNAASLCMMSFQEKHVLLKQLTGSMEGLQDNINAHADTQPVSAGMRFEIDEALFEEVRTVLEVEDFSILKSKYAEIIACLPGNYEATIGTLQSHLSDSDICSILSLDSGHNQKILNCLILKLKTKEDLLDLSSSLEKIDETHSSMERIIKQIRREALQLLLCAEARPKQSSLTPDSPTAATVAKPPKMDFSLFPKLLVAPKLTYACLLPADSQGLAALNAFYPILVKSLPSNHLITLLRLQAIAFVPKEIVDSIVPSPSAEIGGNKMIINYLIGLIHTEEHIIAFCRLVKRMTGEFDKCIAVLNLLNLILKTNEFEEKCLTISNPNAALEVILDPTINVASSTETIVVNKDKEINVSTSLLNDQLKTGQDPSITTLLKPVENFPCYKPYRFESRSMIGFLQCMLISSCGGNFTNTIKAIPLEKPLQHVAKESSVTDSSGKSLSVEDPMEPKDKNNNSVTSVDKGKQVSSNKSHSVAVSILHQDINTIKDLIDKDYEKEYAFSLHDLPGDQKSKQFYLDSIETLFRECSKAGAWIYYNGYGEKGTGNWCFKDGTISFQEIFTLYKTHLNGKLLYIHSDCCYSGNWVVDCAKCLDEMGIGACGHQAIQQNVLIKIFTSCRPNEKAKLQSYVKDGVAFQDNSLCCYTMKELSNSQTTYGCDFTRTFCMQIKGLSAPCRIPDIPLRCTWKWIDIVNTDYTKRPTERVKLVKGTENGRRAWQYILFERELEEEDLDEAAAAGTLDITEHRFIIQSGRGEDPPEDYVDKLKKCCPKY